MAAPKSLSIVIQSTDYGRVHYALVMAAAAAAVDVEVTLFFTMDGVRALTRDHGWRGFDGAEAAEHDLGQKGIARFEELIAALRDLGATFLVCETGLRAAGIDREALRDDIEMEIAGFVTLLSRVGDGAVLYA